MKYATWTLQPDPTTGGLTGPIASAREQGVILSPIMFVGAPEELTILGSYIGGDADLSSWNFTEIPKEAAIAIFSAEFTPMPADLEDGINAVTLEDALDRLFG